MKKLFKTCDQWCNQRLNLTYLLLGLAGELAVIKICLVVIVRHTNH